MVTKGTETTPTEIAPGVTRSILSHAPELMLCEVRFAPGSVVASHQHIHTQSTYVISGSCQIKTSDGIHTLEAGDSILFPPNTPHGVSAPQGALVLDVFSPMREEFLA